MDAYNSLPNSSLFWGLLICQEVIGPHPPGMVLFVLWDTEVFRGQLYALCLSKVTGGFLSCSEIKGINPLPVPVPTWLPLPAGGTGVGLCLVPTAHLEARSFQSSFSLKIMTQENIYVYF